MHQGSAYGALASGARTHDESLTQEENVREAILMKIPNDPPMNVLLPVPMILTLLGERVELGAETYT